MKQAKVLTEVELKRVLAVIGHNRHADRNRLLVMISHYAGLRVGEIAALKVNQVIADDGTARDHIYVNPDQAKRGIGRTVFVNKRLKREIAKYLASLPALPAPHRPLIRSQRGSHFSANSLCQRFMGIYSLAGIDGASSHSGRRFFITKLAHSGVSAKVIMDLAGHKHLSTTQRYIEVNDDLKRAAVELIA